MRHAGLDVDEIAGLVFDHLFESFAEFVAHFAFDDVENYFEANMDVRVGDSSRWYRGDLAERLVVPTFLRDMPCL